MFYNNNNYQHRQHGNAQNGSVHRVLSSITTLTPTALSGLLLIVAQACSKNCGIWFWVREKHRKFPSCHVYDPDTEARARGGKEKALFRFCVDRVWVFMHKQSSKDDRLSGGEKWEMKNEKCNRVLEPVMKGQRLASSHLHRPKRFLRNTRKLSRHSPKSW